MNIVIKLSIHLTFQIFQDKNPMERFHRESDTFAQSSCHDLPSVSASATHSGKLVCSSFRPKWVYDSASPTRDPHDTKSLKLFLPNSLCFWTTVTQTGSVTQSPSRILGHQLWTGLKRESRRAVFHVALHMGSCLGCRPREEKLHSTEDGGEARLLWLQDHQLVPWTDYKQHPYLCTYSSSRLPGAEQMGKHHTSSKGQWRPCFLIHLHSHTLPNQKCLFIILPNTTDFYL